MARLVAQTPVGATVTVRWMRTQARSSRSPSSVGRPATGGGGGDRAPPRHGWRVTMTRRRTKRAWSSDTQHPSQVRRPIGMGEFAHGCYLSEREAYREQAMERRRRSHWGVKFVPVVRRAGLSRASPSRRRPRGRDPQRPRLRRFVDQGFARWRERYDRHARPQHLYHLRRGDQTVARDLRCRVSRRSPTSSTTPGACAPAPRREGLIFYGSGVGYFLLSGRPRRWRRSTRAATDLTPLDVASDLRRDTVLVLQEMGIRSIIHHEARPPSMDRPRPPTRSPWPTRR